MALIVLMVRALARPGERRVSRGPGSGASGAVHDLLNEDKRRKIIVEGRAEHRDPETADDLPPDYGEQAASSSGTARGSRISARRS